MFRPVLIALLLALAVPGVASASSTTQIIIKRDAGLSSAERADIRADADVRLVRTLPLPRTEVVAAAPGDVAAALRELNADPDVVYAERDRPIEGFDDPIFDLMWGLENRGDLYAGAVVDADTDVPDAWNNSTGTGERVAVVDSGADLDHPDLATQLVGGWDYIEHNGTPEDENGHGTHVSGTIAAVKDNNVGVVGVAPSAQVAPLRVLDDQGRGLVSDAILAYGDAWPEEGARIVNASLGGDDFVQAERSAIAANSNVLFVVAAGNGGADGIGDNNDKPALAEYPCAYDLANVLCVGASEPNDAPAEFSNYGATTVDVFAPGYDIASTYLSGGYAYSDGTSMATPHVAGAAALVWSVAPALTPAQVKAVLLQSGDYKGSFAGLSVTGRRLNADAAVELALAGGPLPDGDGDGFIDTQDSCPAAASSDMSNGCPDRDGDGITDGSDNCPTLGNNQTDTDGDGVGDLCDPTPGGGSGGGPTLPPTKPAPPADGDDDGVYDISDGCPNQSARTSDGCPVARVTGISAKVRASGARRSAKLTISTSRRASMRVTVERRKGRRWVTVERATVVTSHNRATLRILSLRRGSHRVRIAISSSSGRGTPVTKAFRVR
jgi:thermitase